MVVAILGILAAIGIASYNGYVDSSKKKSAENIMMQISLAQSEYTILIMIIIFLPELVALQENQTHQMKLKKSYWAEQML